MAELKRQQSSLKRTRNSLMDFGKKGESYTQIINRLVDFWVKGKK